MALLGAGLNQAGIDFLVQQFNPGQRGEAWKNAFEALSKNPKDSALLASLEDAEKPFNDAQEIGRLAAAFISPEPRRHKGLRASDPEE